MKCTYQGTPLLVRRGERRREEEARLLAGHDLRPDRAQRAAPVLREHPAVRKVERRPVVVRERRPRLRAPPPGQLTRRSEGVHGRTAST
jgi:hypothetical protein